MKTHEKTFVAPTCDLVPLEKMKLHHGEEHPSYLEPLSDPRWVPATEAGHMRADDPVLGFHVGSSPYAIPWWIMKNHHVANLTLEGEPLVVKLCEVCSGSAAFEPVVDGRRLTFMVKGAYKGTFVSMDFETGSIWAPFLGEALLGPLQGVRLARRPVLQSSWEEWSSLFPETSVPDGTGESRKGHGAGQHPGSDESSSGFRHTIVNHDERLDHCELVLGVQIGSSERAYPLRTLQEAGPVVNDVLGGMEIVVFSRPRSWMALAFSRERDGRQLEFHSGAEGMFRDRQTGSEWDIRGRAVKGPLAGSALDFVRSGIEEWYSWASYHPGTEIFAGRFVPENFRSRRDRRVHGCEASERVGSATSSRPGERRLV